MKSVLQSDTDYCYICGRYGTEIHHIFFGTANRGLSEKYGMTLGLCPEHHRGNHGVHQNRVMDLKLKEMAQREFIRIYPEADFLAIFGRNYL